ncbi:MAG: hypothetical protein ACYTHM_05645 [Planctomycetota bacterium]|jgi:hypothetical protein
MPETKPAFRFCLHIWFPPYPIDLRNPKALQRSFFLNGVNGKFPGTSRGKHKVMGHCMAHLEVPGTSRPVPEQKFFGKTSPDGPVETAWTKAMALDFPPFLRVWYALAANLLGLEPRYRTPVAPEGGVKTLFTLREPARYEVREEWEASLPDASVTWSRGLTEEEGRKALDWINDSEDPGAPEPQGMTYGFQNACCDWAVGAAIASGALDAEEPIPVRRRLYVHEGSWATAGPMEGEVWRFTEGGPFKHPVDILTPSALHAVLATRPDWHMVRRLSLA